MKRDITRGTWISGWLRLAVVAAVLILGRFLPGIFTRRIGPWILQGPPLGSTALAAMGAALAAAGIALAIWARVHLGRNWSTVPALKEGHELVTSGPYRLIRHPIYTGVIAAALGSALIVPGWIIVFLGALIVFLVRVGEEESLMMRQFPDRYPDYKKRTWALVPYVF